MVKKTKAKTPDPEAVDAWLAALPDDQHALLSTLREQVRAAAPDAVETIAYGVPMFYMGTTPLFGFGAFKAHVTFGVGHETLDTMRDELADYDVAKDTIRIVPARPLTATLVKKLVKTCLALHAAKAG